MTALESFATMKDGTLGSALISECGRYRYRLTRRWHHTDKGLLPFVMLNPSKASAFEDDPTIRRCMGFARREGFDGIEVVNLYGLRATKPTALWEADDPYGPDNHRALHMLLHHVVIDYRSGILRPVVCAWGGGAKPEAVRRFVTTVRHLTANQPHLLLRSLKVTKAGAPGHPLYIKGDAPLMPYDPAA